jgi:nucleoside-diphosphate-sugar epimerase
MQTGAAGARAVVTGASGFIGQHLVRALSARGQQVIPLSRSTGFDVTRDELPLTGGESVFHLAALTGVPASWQAAAEFLRVNAYGTARVLEQCQRLGAKPIFVSAYIYGRPERMPIAEDATIDANNPYAFSKYAAEQACRFYSEHCALPVAVVRPFNVYGSGQESRFLIPWIVEQALDPARARVELTDLAPRRDYVHVSDVVAAVLAVASAGVAGTFNVGSGESFSVAEVAAKIVHFAGVDKPVVATGAPRPNEIDDVRADITRIQSATGWRPRVSLDEGLRQMVEDARRR